MAANGLVIPSRDQLRQQQQLANYRQLAGIGDSPNGVTMIGNGLAVDSRGNVIVIPEGYGGVAAPRSQMEAEDTVDRLIRVLEQRNLIGSQPSPQQMHSHAKRESAFQDATRALCQA